MIMMIFVAAVVTVTVVAVVALVVLKATTMELMISFPSLPLGVPIGDRLRRSLGLSNIRLGH